MALNQHRVITVEIDLKHNRILSMELTLPDHQPNQPQNYYANNFGDDLDLVYTYQDA